MKYDVLESKIGYVFNDKSLINLAVMHSSYGNDHKLGRLHNNERLEFLGDAVLELSVSESLFHMYMNKPEGELTKMRASIVCEPTLAQVARDIGLPEFILLGRGEEHTGGRSRDSIISDALEAMIGAIYLDGGFANAKEFIMKFIMNDIEEKQLFYDSKTILQEYVQKEYRETVHYELVSECGPDHCKTFCVEVKLGNKVLGAGEGKSKKSAEQKAAYEALMNREGNF